MEVPYNDSTAATIKGLEVPKNPVSDLSREHEGGRIHPGMAVGVHRLMFL